MTYIIENTFYGTIAKFDNLLDAFKYLGNNDLKEWFYKRIDIPSKSSFIIEEVNKNKTKQIVKIKSNILFNIKK